MRPISTRCAIPGNAWAICEEYHAAAGIDVEHDRADRDAGHRIACPVLALWSAHGPLDDWYPERPARAVAPMGRQFQRTGRRRRSFLSRGGAAANGGVAARFLERIG